MDKLFPSIVTTRRIKGTNFIFHVYAYRKVTDSEFKYALRLWLQDYKLIKVPKTGFGKRRTILGLDD